MDIAEEKREVKSRERKEERRRIIKVENIKLT